MFDRLLGRKKRDEEFLQMIRASAEGHDLAKIRQAIATISADPLNGDRTEIAATASAILATAIVKEAITQVADDDDRFTAGCFAFVFSDHISRLTAGNFEMAAVGAVLKTLGADEFPRCFNAIQSAHSRMVVSKATLLQAIGENCAAWINQPTPDKFGRLIELLRLARKYTEESSK